MVKNDEKHTIPNQMPDVPQNVALWRWCWETYHTKRDARCHPLQNVTSSSFLPTWVETWKVTSGPFCGLFYIRPAPGPDQLCARSISDAYLVIREKEGLTSRYVTLSHNRAPGNKHSAHTAATAVISPAYPVTNMKRIWYLFVCVSKQCEV